MTFGGFTHTISRRTFFFALLLPSAFCLLAFCSCGGSDDPQQVVRKLRILGVRADSPEVTAEFRENGIPLIKPGAVKLEALVADPKGNGRPVDVYWAACGIIATEIAGNFDCDGENGLALEHSTFRPLSYFAWLSEKYPEFDPALVEESGVTTTLSAGYPVFTWLRASAGDETQVALKRITFIETDARNTNPEFDGIDVLVPAEAGVDDVVVVDETPYARVPFGPGVAFKADREFPFMPAVNPASYEQYVDGLSGETKTEEPIVMWYSSDGEFGNLMSGKNYPDNTWRSPKLEKDEQERRVDFWFVLLDLRGGIDWVETKGVRVVR
ncbi:MAG: hypothetical protein HY897_21755 [Deltaproteobacteria bacterium]|nr:hypothetical protein [Deltaproteobacteria bacterium]